MSPLSYIRQAMMFCVRGKHAIVVDIDACLCYVVVQMEVSYESNPYHTHTG
jgi:hypothetical protein